MILTAVKSGVTTTVTSFDILAVPQVGVDVHTMIHVPAPKMAPVGVNEAPVCPERGVIVPPDTVRVPHCLPVMVPPPVSEAVRAEPVEPVPDTQIV